MKDKLKKIYISKEGFVYMYNRDFWSDGKFNYGEMSEYPKAFSQRIAGDYLSANSINDDVVDAIYNLVTKPDFIDWGTKDIQLLIKMFDENQLPVLHKANPKYIDAMVSLNRANFIWQTLEFHKVRTASEFWETLTDEAQSNWMHKCRFIDTEQSDEFEWYVIDYIRDSGLYMSHMAYDESTESEYSEDV